MIKRWTKYGELYPGDDGEMSEHPEGEWVRWEDVRSYFEPTLVLPTDTTEVVVLLTRCGCERTVSIVKGENKCMLPLRPSYHARAYNAGDFPNYVGGPVYGSRDFMWQGRRRNTGVRIFEEQ